MNAPLKEWVEEVFGQSVVHIEGDLSSWQRSIDHGCRLEKICGPDLSTLLRLTEVFENPAILQPYPDGH